MLLPLVEEKLPFAKFATDAALREIHHPDGIYIWVGRPRQVHLVHSDLDLNDFFVPNGSFNGKTFELHSPITDDRSRGDAGPYLTAPTGKPASETEGTDELNVIGDVYTNLPTATPYYVRRPQLENELRESLIDDRHPIVTLVGRGGIGKTSLALTVLHELANDGPYEIVVWFSARDIDLTPTGPKVVQPKTLSDRDIAQEYGRLMSAFETSSADSHQSVDIVSEHMRSSPYGTTLFVFDNFETVRYPNELYNWIDTNIRLPNKALITSRFRDFKADFPIEVSGMETKESYELIYTLASRLGIRQMIRDSTAREVVEESDGHPYVIKIMLGEMADNKKYGKPEKLLARRDDILDSLFERTHDHLSPIANRIFLTLSGWRSLVPQLAIEAVLHWRCAERVTPEHAVDELIRMSLIERTTAPDDTDFLGVPVAAALFGRTKLEVSPEREVILDDIYFLQDFGPTMATGLNRGILPRIQSIFRNFAQRISDELVAIENARPVLEFMSRNYPPAWLLFADIEEVVGDTDRVAKCIRSYLEQVSEGEGAVRAWRRLGLVYRRLNDVRASCSAFLNASRIVETELDEISSMANYINSSRDLIVEMDPIQRSAILRPLARLMETHIEKASATDLSRLAWLYLHSEDETRALQVAKLGIDREVDNLHCLRLVQKIRSEI